MLRLNDYQCSKCGKVRERLAAKDETLKSLCCGAPTVKLFPIVRVNMGAAGAYGYYDETLGTYVNTNRERRELCRQQGVTPKGDTPKPDGEAWV